MPRHQRILVADSSKYFNNSTWRMLMADTEFEIVGMADSTAETVQMAVLLSPDIILVDLSQSENCGLQTVAALHQISPHTPIITFMPISSSEYTRASLDAGATACLPKSEMAGELLQALRNLSPAPLVLGVPS
ncbi:MAG: response regulator transcription factor [Anaerolineae bacterium]|nr:response regulator transcription factor [Anaerolineae bacterium]